MEIYSSRFSKYFYDKPLDEVTKWVLQLLGSLKGLHVKRFKLQATLIFN